MKNKIELGLSLLALTFFLFFLWSLTIILSFNFTKLNDFYAARQALDSVYFGMISFMLSFLLVIISLIVKFRKINLLAVLSFSLATVGLYPLFKAAYITRHVFLCSISYNQSCVSYTREFQHLDLSILSSNQQIIIVGLVLSLISLICYCIVIIRDLLRKKV